MSRKRASAHSHGHSSHTDRSISVTQASLEDFHLGDTTNEPYLPGPSAYVPSSQTRRHSSHPRPGTESDYLQNPYEPGGSTAYPELQSYPSYDASLEGTTSLPFLADDPSFDTTALSGANMSGYPYSHEATHGYRGSGAYPGASSTHGYSNPSPESLSRSMSGPPSLMLPTSILPSSTYGEFRETGREVGRQRRRNVAQVRREHKARTRRAAMLPNMPLDSGSSQADIVSGPIDSFAAHSTSSFGGRSSYTSPHVPGSAFAASSSSYSPYANTYSTAPPYPTYGTTSTLGPPSPFPPHRSHSRSSGTPNQEPVVLEQQKKPQCWDHGCNGRAFSTFSNLLRHQREKSGASTKSYCPRCKAEFTRKTARDGHLAHDKCKAVRRERD